MNPSVLGGKKIAILLASFWVVATIILSFPNPKSHSSMALEGGSDYSTFLPLVESKISTIYGQVTFGNLGPIADVELDLRFFNGVEWSTILTTTTDEDGIYRFVNVPALQAGQRYYVRYLNTEIEGYLYTWHAKLITSLQGGQEINGGDFNIGGIYLNAPPAGSQLFVPIEFRWSKRNGFTNDSYELNLFEPQTGSPYFYTNPSLGFVDTYTLNNLPAGFKSGTWYVWNIWVYGEGGNADGNWGISYWSYYLRLYGTSNSELEGIQKISSAEVIANLVNSGELPIDLDLGK